MGVLTVVSVYACVYERLHLYCVYMYMSICVCSVPVK